MDSKESTEPVEIIFAKQTPYHLGKKPACYNSTMKTWVTMRIFKLSPIHASVIYQFP